MYCRFFWCSTIPMQGVMEFALSSARRQSEIRRLEWVDNDDRNQTGMVRDANHPTAREGNHRRFKYTPEAWAIVQTAPNRHLHLSLRSEECRGSFHPRMPFARNSSPAVSPSATRGDEPPV